MFGITPFLSAPSAKQNPKLCYDQSKNLRNVLRNNIRWMKVRKRTSLNPFLGKVCVEMPL